jgi:RNA polymerase sigma-70 factor (ECF subfamily)
MRYTSNVDKYRAFYSEHKDKLFAYLMRITADYYLSSDIMQESFTRYLEHYSQEPPSLPLLYTIARNALLDHARRERHKTELEGDQADCSGDQEQVLMVRQEYRHVLLAMKELEKDERDLLALAVSGDFSYREIASIAGISKANVKVKVHRARLKLKEVIHRGDI